MSGEPLLKVSGVETYYGNIRALAGVDIDVKKGEIVSLIGANGAGKSTLMMTICGSPQARHGSVEFDGRDITRMPTHEIARLKPGSVDANAIDRAISAAAAAQEKQLQALAEASRLRAPMDGFVSAILKRPGENALAGEPVLMIGALRASRIVAFARQPLHTALKVGDLVDVQLRRSPRTRVAARVLQVGSALEPIEPTLLPLPSTSRRVAELGLPLLIEIPAGLTLAPGEAVNLSVHSP